MTPTKKVLAEKFSFTSSLNDDVWHAQKNPKAYEWWYFDALSDDGREAVVIIFFDNFVFSPRYNAKNQSEKTPALAFFYYRDGKPLYRIIREFSKNDFSAGETEPFCRIKENSFKFDSAPYGKGYILDINLNFPQNKKLEAKLEWLLIESDFDNSKKTISEKSHCWNLVAPRADVTGHINVTNQKGKKIDAIHFRGSGYHDHNFDNRWMPQTVNNWQWGRAHFADATAVFYRYQETGEKEATTKLYVVLNGELREYDAEFEEQQFSRDIFGIKYPNRLRFMPDDNIRLRVKQIKAIDSSFFYLRFLSEMTLTLRDGKPRKTIGITEHLATKTLNYRWLDWLIDMRINRKG